MTNNQKPSDQSSAGPGLSMILGLAGYFVLGSIFFKVGYGPGTFTFWLSFGIIFLLQAIGYSLGARSHK